jgi:hypothetical protein
VYNFPYDLVQIGWGYDSQYDKKIERLHVKYDFSYESTYISTDYLVHLSQRKAKMTFSLKRRQKNVSGKINLVQFKGHRFVPNGKSCVQQIVRGFVRLDNTYDDLYP